MPNLNHYLSTRLARFTGGKGLIMLGASYGALAAHAMATLSVLNLKSIYRMFSGYSIRTSHVIVGVDPEILLVVPAFFMIIGAFAGATLANGVESSNAKYERAAKRIPGLLPGIVSSSSRERQTKLWLLLFILIIGYAFMYAVLFVAFLKDIPLSSGELLQHG